MTWLITGGAGYIGSHVVDEFISRGESVVVLDNLSSGIYKRIENKCDFAKVDITSLSTLTNVFDQYHFDGVIHLAALKSVTESQLYPVKYHHVNVEGTSNLLKLSEIYGVRLFINSSSASVYGNSEFGTVSEYSPLKPMSIYGETKLKAEKILDSYINADKIDGVSLRFFNVVGAKNFELRDSSVANLFPILRNQINNNQQPEIFGDDYPTPDGTCIRDYVHVLDIARAHYQTAINLKQKKIAPKLNLGTGIGYSVFEIMKAMYAYHNLELRPIVKSRRLGDPAKLIADVNLARSEIDFSTVYGLPEMIGSTF